MPLSVHQFPCLAENYAAVILRELAQLGWRLALILNTHWHPDHAGGNAEVKAATGAEIVGPKEVTRIAPLDREVRGGDQVLLGESRFEVIEAGGHTLGHIAYYAAADGAAFVGDTLFALGCGRLFEGDAAQMWGSLQRLAALPDDTRVYCAHEYTAANARFALSIDDDPALAARARQVFAARERGEPTVPSTIGLEKATNPFLRAPLLADRFGAAGRPAHQAFAAVRAAKDAFKG